MNRTQHLTAAAVILAAALGLWACSTNPATGKQQLNLYSQEQEVALGRQYHEQVVQQIGLYPDEELQRYVQRVGARLAAGGERPELPWTFRVVDDASVNAFALPGGFIYLTRGILTHFNSEAEMAAVLGHEIGHVTARHQVNQMSKAQLTQVGLTLGMILSPEARQYGDLANLAGGLLFLKFGRDDERQADDLGLRYLHDSQYPAEAMGEVFGLLARVSAKSEQGRLPGFLTTHPYPEERRERMETQYAGLPDSVASPSWQRQPYLQQLDGVVFGPDPREGFFRGSRFYHPELRFQLDAPEGWKGVNQKQAVAWQSPRADALLVLSLSQERTVRQAARAFFNQQGVRSVGNFPVQPGSGSSLASTFYVASQQNPLQGAVAFTEHGGRVFQLLGFTRPNDWRRYADDVGRSMQSFRALTERRYLDVEPMRVDMVRVGSAMTLAEFDRRFPSSISLEDVALINNMTPSTQLRTGQEVKRVRGFNPERE